MNGLNEGSAVDVGIERNHPKKKWSSLPKIALAVLAVSLVAVEGIQFWQLHKLRRDLEDVEWNTAVQDLHDDNVITPDVGTIQFLKKGGYSIQLETAKYTGDGLYLKGFFGNPTNLWLTNLTVKIAATKQTYEYRDEFKNDSFFFGLPSIGEAQSSPIPTLNPGSRQLFEVTIPNVKQTKSGVRLTVVFAGERYSYAQ